MIGFDYIIITCHEARVYLGSTNSAYINIIFWIPSCVLLFLLATSVGYFISPDVDGSGFPEMKAVLSGITSGLDKYFSFNTFIAKIIGLFAFIVSGKYYLLINLKVLQLEGPDHLCIYQV